MRIQTANASSLGHQTLSLFSYYLIGSAFVGSSAWLASAAHAPVWMVVGTAVSASAIFGFVQSVLTSGSAPTSINSVAKAFAFPLWTLTELGRAVARAFVRCAAPVSIAALFGARLLVGPWTSVPTLVVVFLEVGVLGAGASVVMLYQYRQRRRLLVEQYRVNAARMSVSRISEVIMDLPFDGRPHELSHRVEELLRPMADQRLWGDGVAFHFILPEQVHIEDVDDEAATYMRSLAKHSMSRRQVLYVPSSELQYAMRLESYADGYSNVEWEPLEAEIGNSPWRSTLAVPVASGLKSIGVLTITSRRHRAFSPLDVSFAQYLAQIVTESFEIRGLLQNTGKSAKAGKHSASVSYKRGPAAGHVVPALGDVGSYGSNWPWWIALRDVSRILRGIR